MNRLQRPSTLVLLALILALGFGGLVLPNVLAGKLAREMQERFGLELAHGGWAGLALDGSFGLALSDVTLTRPGSGPTPIVGARSLHMPVSLFSGHETRMLHLEDPVFSFEIGGDPAETDAAAPQDNAAETPEAKAKRPIAVSVRNGTVKLHDRRSAISLQVTDVSGRIVRDGENRLDLELRGLLNGKPTALNAQVDDAGRLVRKGSPSDIALSSDNVQIVAAGLLSTAGDIAFDGTISVESPDVRAFAAWLGLPLNGFAQQTPLALDGGLSISKTRAAFANAALALGGMTGKGNILLTAGTPRPRLDAALDFNLIDVNVYRLARDEKPKKAAAAETWSEAPLDFTDIAALDGKVTLKTADLRAGAMALGAASIDATLDKGLLQSRVVAPSLYGGQGNLKFSLTAEERTKMTLDLDIAGAEAQQALQNIAGMSFLSGPLDIKAQLTSEGNSQASLISSLAGALSVTLRESQVNGIDLARLAGLVGKEDQKGWGSEARSATALSEATLSAKLQDGIATLADSQVETKALSAKLSGEVDLLRRAVDVVIRPKAKAGNGGGMALPLAFAAKGPWGEPKLTARLDAGELKAKDAIKALTGEEISDEDAEKLGKKAKKGLKKLFGN